MPRLNPIDPKTAQGKAKQLLDAVQNKFGTTPNLMRTLANSPVALQAYLGLMNALEDSGIDAKTRESIALATSGANGCEYCASAHTALGKMHGLSADEAARNLEGHSADQTVEAILQFSRAIVEKRGWVSDQDLRRIREMELGDAEISDIVATVATTIFSNNFNHIAKTEVDFPLVTLNRKSAA
jgi:uncharacterized peroxidase-related enzyme